MSDAKLPHLVDNELLPSSGSSKETLVGILVGGEDDGGDAPLAVLEVSSVEKFPGEVVSEKLEESVVEELSSVPGGAVSVPQAAINVEVGMVDGEVRVTEPESGGIGNGAGKTSGEGTATATLSLVSAMEVGEGSSGDDEDEKIVMAAGESNVVSETVSAVKRPLDVARVKTSLCSYFRKRGCRHGENCVYAHGESELQQRPDGTWDPTSERAKNVVAVEKMESVSGAAAAPEQAGQFQKCLVHVPKGWSQIKLKSFLDEHVSGSTFHVLMMNFYSISHVQ